MNSILELVDKRETARAHSTTSPGPTPRHLLAYVSHRGEASSGVSEKEPSFRLFSNSRDCDVVRREEEGREGSSASAAVASHRCSASPDSHWSVGLRERVRSEIEKDDDLSRVVSLRRGCCNG